MVSAWFEGEVTLLPFPYLRVGVLLACGVSSVCGLRRQSLLPFVVRHGLGFVDRIIWPLDGPGTCCFLELSLGSSLSLPVLTAGLRWLRFILGCPPSVASLWRVLTWFSVHDHDVAFPPLVGFAFGLIVVPLPQADAVGFGLCWSARLSGLLTGQC